MQSDGSYPSTITFNPVKDATSVIITVPGSKSITNRALLLAALAEGESTLYGALDADDTQRMIDGLRQFGVKIDWTAKDTIHVVGQNGALLEPDGPIDVNNSGTTIRFLTAAAPLAHEGARVVLTGNPRMKQRPIKDLIDSMVQFGAHCRYLSEDGFPPVEVRGGGYAHGSCRLKGDVSSQYLSGLLMAAPLCGFDVNIDIEGDLVSKPYAAMTLSMMLQFGVDSLNLDYHKILVRSGQKYKAQSLEIEPDASNASYFLAAAALTGGSVAISGVGKSSLQGDAAFVEVLRAMGCTICLTSDKMVVTGPKELNSVVFDMSAIPDTAQTAAVLALYAKGTTVLSGLETLKVKETDRIEALRSELTKMGALVLADDRSLTITPPAELRGAKIDTYDDHRMAMSFALAGLKTPGVIINDPGCVAKTFPTFWKTWREAFGNVVG